MLNIELTQFGLDDVLKQIEKDLKSALTSRSKKRKNEMIYKALGAVDALGYMFLINEVDSDEVNE